MAKKQDNGRGDVKSPDDGRLKQNRSDASLEGNREGGRKGGEKVSQDREHMSRIGRKGGKASR